MLKEPYKSEYYRELEAMTAEQLVEYLRKLPSVPSELPEKFALKAGIAVIDADTEVNRYGKVIGLVFWCKYCNQMHHHSIDEGMRREHCPKPSFKLGQYYLKPTGKELYVL